MPYKGKEEARKSARERQRKHRQGVTGCDENVTPLVVTPIKDVTPAVTPYIPPIVRFDPAKVLLMQKRMQDYYDENRRG